MNIRRPRVAPFAAVAVALALTLTACAPGGQQEPTSAPVAIEVEEPTETATAEPTRAPLSELVLTHQGIADIRIGEPVPEGDPAVQPFVWDATGCSGYPGVVEGGPYAGYWHSADPATPHMYGPPHAFVVVTADGLKSGAVDAVRVWSDVRTAEGIGIGSTRAEVEAAYPSPTAVISRGDLSTVYVMEEGDRRLSIEVADPDTVAVGYWTPEQTDRVLWMWAETTKLPADGFAGGDGGGPCPV